MATENHSKLQNSVRIRLLKSVSFQFLSETDSDEADVMSSVRLHQNYNRYKCTKHSL